MAWQEPLGYLGVYHVERVWGGPEEGGWWYDEYRHVCSAPFWDDEQEQRERLEARIYPPCHKLSSVLSEGEMRVLCEDRPAEYQDTQRPSYA